MRSPQGRNADSRTHHEGQQNSTKDPLKSYRAYTKAIVLMNGRPWTPETELTTALDFSLNTKVVEAGSDLLGAGADCGDTDVARSGKRPLDGAKDSTDHRRRGKGCAFSGRGLPGGSGKDKGA